MTNELNEQDELLAEAQVVANKGKPIDLNTRTQFMIGTPIGLKIELEKAAKEANKSVGRFVLEIVAGSVGYKLPTKAEGTGKAKMTDEQKKAAQKARNAEQRRQIRELLAATRAEEGLLDDDEDEEDDEDEA